MASPASIVPRFEREGYGPGDTITGVLEVVAPVGELRRLDAYLQYVDRSPGFAGAVTGAAAEPLHEGPVEVGDRIPFSFVLPADALPSWSHPRTDEMGTLAWALVTRTDVAGGPDTTTTHDVPVADGARGAWRGPAPPTEPNVIASGGKWDVTVEPDRWAARRGESFSVTLDIAKPGPGRATIELAFMGRAGYDVETSSPTSDRDTSARRETRWATLFEAHPEVDPNAARQTFEFAVPAGAPFTYEGEALVFRWYVLAKESRLLRSDPHRSARLTVLP